MCSFVFSTKNQQKFLHYLKALYTRFLVIVWKFMYLYMLHFLSCMFFFVFSTFMGLQSKAIVKFYYYVILNPSSLNFDAWKVLNLVCFLYRHIEYGQSYFTALLFYLTIIHKNNLIIFIFNEAFVFNRVNWIYLFVL